MTEFLIGEKLLLHLYKFRTVNIDDYYNIPWDMTQDGIATALRISRAHASIELKKHREKGNITEAQVHIKGGKVKRKSYALTSKGIAEAQRLEQIAIDNGIDVNSLLDLKRQNPTKLLEGLTEKDRRALGCACAFRVAIPMNLLPEHERSVIPMDAFGNTSLSEELRMRLMGAASVEELHEWHSFAADLWMEPKPLEVTQCDSVVERLYHLLMAGRKKEACKLIDRDVFDLMYIQDRSLYLALKPMTGIPEQYAQSVMMLKIEMAITNRELDSAKKFATELADIEGYDALGYAYIAKIALIRDDKIATEDAVSKIKNSGNLMACIKLAEAYLDLEEPEKAKKEIAKVDELIPKDYVAAGVQKFIVLARIAVMENRGADAARYFEKANASADSNAKKCIKALRKELCV